MASIFDTIAVRSLPESVFDLSHEVKLSGNMGELIPILLEEVIPGDTFQVKSNILMRLAPMLAPIMHRVDVYVHYFYVPNRIVWENFHDHITGGEDGLANPPHPYISMTQSLIDAGYYAKGSLADYYGIPTWEAGSGVPTSNVEMSALPFRGYQTIYNEYYRDQDLTPAIDVPIRDGSSTDPSTILDMRKRSWQRDYFTSARPNSQKGPEVVIPNTGQVNYKFPNLVRDNLGALSPSGDLTSGQGAELTAGVYHDGTNQRQVSLDNIESVDTTITVEDQRRANRLQEWLELAQRGGSRINEVIRNFFGVVPDDLRLTRPQYLGGGKQPIVMSEVLNTAGDADGTTLQPLGEYGGHGMSVGASNRFTKSFKEHGYVHGIMSVLPKTAYQQGMHRHWNKFDKYEKYWPQFANIGEQEIKQKEIYLNPFDTEQNRDRTFGYAPRYSEYKYACDRVAGDFRKDQNADNLSFWHMGRYFETEPALNSEFVESNPTHRIFAVKDETVDKLYVQIQHSVRAKRKMPFHNIPSNMPI